MIISVLFALGVCAAILVGLAILLYISLGKAFKNPNIIKYILMAPLVPFLMIIYLIKLPKRGKNIKSTSNERKM